MLQIAACSLRGNGHRQLKVSPHYFLKLHDGPWHYRASVFSMHGQAKMEEIPSSKFVVLSVESNTVTIHNYTDFEPKKGHPPETHRPRSQEASQEAQPMPCRWLHVLDATTCRTAAAWLACVAMHS